MVCCISIHRRLRHCVGLGLLFLFGLSPAFLQAEVFVGAIYGRNEGKQILETGSKTADSRGFRGGSRLTYPRNLRYFGLEGRYLVPNFIFRGRYTTSGWQVNAGTAENEDFNLFTISSIRDSGYDYKRNRFRDTPYAISGSRNFAYARGKTALFGYDLATRAEWYWQDSKGEEQLGFFLSVGLSYAYFKYEVYDVMQWIRQSNGGFLYVPIGTGNSFTNNQIEYPIGLGYAFAYRTWRFQGSLEYNNGYNTGKDYHKQRQINFRIKNTYGNGYNLLLGAEHSFADSPEWMLAFQLRAHHYYSKGEIGVYGGIGTEYILTLAGATQGVFLSTKETSGEISILRRF